MAIELKREPREGQLMYGFTWQADDPNLFFDSAGNHDWLISWFYDPQKAHKAYLSAIYSGINAAWVKPEYKK